MAFKELKYAGLDFQVYFHVFWQMKCPYLSMYTFMAVNVISRLVEQIIKFGISVVETDHVAGLPQLRQEYRALFSINLADKYINFIFMKWCKCVEIEQPDINSLT